MLALTAHAFKIMEKIDVGAQSKVGIRGGAKCVVLSDFLADNFQTIFSLIAQHLR